MRVILTVIGKDKVGIIAGVSQKLAELEINILDVSQTIMDDYFTMMMMLTMDKSSDFETIRKELNQVGESLGVSIKCRMKRFLTRCINYKKQLAE